MSKGMISRYGETIDGYLVARAGHGFYVVLGLCGDEGEYSVKPGRWTFEGLVHTEK